MWSKMEITGSDSYVTISFTNCNVTIPILVKMTGATKTPELSYWPGVGPVWNRENYDNFVREFSADDSEAIMRFGNGYTNFTLSSGKLYLNILTDGGEPIVSSLELGMSREYMSGFKELGNLIQSKVDILTAQVTVSNTVDMSQRLGC